MRTTTTMESQLSLGEVIGLATEKVNLGRQLMSHLKDLLEVEGVRRIKEQISREVNNLLIAINEGTISVKAINASKLLHLECLVKILLKCRALTSVDYVLPLEESDTDPMRVDIMCENGACSVNVEAKNLHTLSNSLNEAANSGHQRILNQAEEFVEAATSNPEVPKPPQMCLIFDNDLDQGQSKGGMDDSLLDFVNSIVRMDQTDRQWEFHLKDTHQSEAVVEMPPEEVKQTEQQREYKRIQMQQRRANPIIRSSENDRKRGIKAELGPPQKYEKFARNHNGGILQSDEDRVGHVEELEEDTREELLHESNGMVGSREFKTEEDGVYELTHQVEADEQTQTVVVMDGPPTNEAYSESQNYFCDSCKEPGLAYEQEILRLREELKQKDSIINSLKSLIGPAGTRIILPGGEHSN